MMDLIESELGDALTAPVKRKGNNTRKLRATAKRVVSNSSEVMVKVTGFGKGAGHVKAHLDYITRNGKLEMENDRGEIFTDKSEVNDFFKDWKQDFADSKRHKNQRDTMHMVLSMPDTVDSESVKNAVRDFAKTTFGKNHEYVFVLHTDQPHPHCHLTVKCLGHDGTRLNPRKADLQQWREEFADKLRDQGVDAEATPRFSRGVVQKATKQAVRHIDKDGGDKSHPPRVSKVKAAKVKEVAQELVAEAKGLPVKEKPWEAKIRARRESVKRAWLASADALEQEKPQKTINHKEISNERPNYERISIERASSGHRAAALYQSHLEKSGRGTPPKTLASLRNVSSLRLVHHERASKMLLRANAPDRLGQQRAADSEMRRSGIGDSRASGREERIEAALPLADQNKALAAQIRAFVGVMPPLETERDQIKRQLTEKFTKHVERAPVDALRPSMPPEQNKGADIAAPVQKPKDIER